jgi:AcrR family transcriptional regulator
MTVQTLSLTRQTRRLRILEAAERVFRAEGFRGASMERIAEAAGVSKVTLYGYFSDKEAVFQGVARTFADRLLAAFETALAGDAAPDQRIADALAGKHLAVFDTVRRSAQARDLFAARDRIAANVFEQLDMVMIGQLAQVITGLGIGEPDRIAHLLFAAAQGIANDTPEVALAEANIRLLVRAILHS